MWMWIRKWMISIIITLDWCPERWKAILFIGVEKHSNKRQNSQNQNKEYYLTEISSKIRKKIRRISQTDFDSFLRSFSDFFLIEKKTEIRQKNVLRNKKNRSEMVCYWKKKHSRQRIYAQEHWFFSIIEKGLSFFEFFWSFWKRSQSWKMRSAIVSLILKTIEVKIDTANRKSRFTDVSRQF